MWVIWYIIYCNQLLFCSSWKGTKKTIILISTWSETQGGKGMRLFYCHSRKNKTELWIVSIQSCIKYTGNIHIFSNLELNDIRILLQGGYKGFYSRNTMLLDPKVVNDIHKRGGTILGTSRGGQNTKKIVDSIQDRGINQVPPLKKFIILCELNQSLLQVYIGV